MTGELHTVQVDFTGLMEVLGKNLYSTPRVAVRELVQNAHDSCQRRLLEGAPADYAPQIRIKTRGERLIIEDNGAGLTRSEIVDYLATIGAGYTRKLRAQRGDQGLIGAFGLGFLSAYVISERVEVRTRSASEPGQRWRFVSRTGERFSIEPMDGPDAAEAWAEPEPQALRAGGTQIVLTLRQEFLTLAQPEALREVLQLYCGLLPHPIWMDQDEAPLNEPAPWRQQATGQDGAQAAAARLAFAQRFDPHYEPLVALPIPASPEGVVEGGIFWIQGGSSYATTDNRAVSVFVRGMLVSRDERELLPAWAGCFGAVLASDALTPTASREDLMRDADYASAQAHLRESIIQSLERLSRQEPATWRRVMRRHNEALRGAALADERLFALLADELTVPTSQGELTMPQLGRSGRHIHVSMYETRGHEEVLFRALQRPIIDGLRFASLGFTRRYCERRGLSLVQLGTRQGQASLFPPEALRPAQAHALQARMGRPGYAVKPTRFMPERLHAVLVYDRDVELKRRMEDDATDARISAAALGLARLYTATIEQREQATLYVNLNSPVIRALLEAPVGQADEGASALVAQMVWGLATLMAPSQDHSGQLDGALEALSQGLARLLSLPHPTRDEEADP